MKFDSLTLMADQMQIYKYCNHQVAHIYARPHFMPKPVYGATTLGHALPSVDLEGRQAGISLATNTPTLGNCLSTSPASSKHAKAINGLHQPLDQLLQTVWFRL